MRTAAQRDVVAFSKKQVAYLSDFCNVRLPRMIAKTGRGGSKTMLSSIGCAAMAYCLPSFTVTINAGSLGQAQENYRYWRAFCDAPDMRPPYGPVIDDPRATYTPLRFGGFYRILAASEKQAKSPHPMMVVLDEACAADPNIIALVEGQLVGAPHPYGGRQALYRIQSTPDKLFHPFRDRWEKRKEAGYAVHEWGARDCPWVSEEEIQQLVMDNDSNWANIHIDGEFGSATGTVWQYKDVLSASIPSLQEDPTGLWPEIEEDQSLFVERAATGVDWGWRHPTAIVTVVLVETPAQEPRVYVVHAETQSEMPQDPLIAHIMAAAGPWHASIYADSSDMRENDAIRRTASQAGLGARSVAFSKYNLAMIGAVGARLEKSQMMVPLSGEGALLLRQMADYSWEEKGITERPIKLNDDLVDALKLAVWGLRRGQAGPVSQRLRPPGPRGETQEQRFGSNR